MQPSCSQATIFQILHKCDSTTKLSFLFLSWGLHGYLSGRELACQCRRHRRYMLDPWVKKIPWTRKRQPIPVFLPGESHGQRSLAGYSPWCSKESDRTEWLSTHARTCSYGVVNSQLLVMLELSFPISWRAVTGPECESCNSALIKSKKALQTEKMNSS